MFTGAGKHRGNGLYAESKSRFVAYTDTLSGRSSGLTWTLQQPHIDQDLPDAFPRFRVKAGIGRPVRLVEITPRSMSAALNPPIAAAVWPTR